MDDDPTLSQRPAPSAEGTLARTPLAHVFLYVRERSLSGTLALVCGPDAPGGDGLEGESLLTFETGMLAQARLPSPLDTLGFVLREKGSITEAQLHESLARMSTGEGLQGQILLSMGACVDLTLEDAVREQVRRKALRLLAVGDARYAYYNGVDLLQGWGAPQRFLDDPLPVVWRAVRAHAATPVVDGVLARAGDQALRLRGGGGELQLFEFDRSEQSVLDVLRAGPSTIDQLARASGADGRLGRLLAYVLLIAKQVDLVPPPVRSPSQARMQAQAAPTRSLAAATRPFTVPTAAVTRPAVETRAPSDPPAVVPPSNPPATIYATDRPAVPSRPPSNPAVARPSRPPGPRSTASLPTMRAPPAPRPPSKPPPGMPADIVTKLAESEARLLAMQDETYFQMLGVAPTASEDEIDSAFAQSASRWHPDRAPPGHDLVREAYQSVFALLNEAQQTLSDAPLRSRYLATVNEGGGTPNSQRRMVAMIEAATDAQKAEICLRRREYDETIRLARRALKVNADDPTTLCVLAQALLEKPGSDPAMTETEQLLNRALEMSPQHDRAHTLLGTVYKRRGVHAKAQAHFRAAMEANPRNLDATREVRLANMRGTTTPRSGTRDRPGSDKPPGGDDKGGGLLSRWLKR